MERMAEAILDAQGREVLFVGRIDSEGRVKAIVVAARGDESSVPALGPHMEKGDVVLHNHPGGNLRPSKADLSIASDLGSHGIGFFIVDNEVSSVYVVAEPVQAGEKRPLDEDLLAAILEPGGILSGKMPLYETRESQIQMLRFTAQAFNEGGIAIAEAGTGVGKSLAYLIPALAWVCQNDERVVISTATINLQEQLMDKDIPLVRRLLKKDVPAVLVKGRGNYLCRTRLREALEEKTFFDADGPALEDLNAWAQETPTGARSDLPFFPGEGLWPQVCSEAESCLGLRCVFREKCFLLKARREAAAARVLVVNHHLLFADLSLRIHGMGFDTTAVLPPFRRIIFDEAHNIENSATSFFSESVNRLMVYRAMGRLLYSKGSKRGGLYPKLAAKTGGGTRTPGRSETPAPGEAQARQPKKRKGRRRDADETEKIPALIAAARAAAESLEAASLPLVMETGNFRLTENTAEAAEETLFRMRALQQNLLELAENLAGLIKELSDEDRESPEAYEMRMLIKRIEGMAGVCEEFRSYGEKTERIFWMERKPTGTGNVFLNYVSTPLNIGSLMREAVYEPFDTIVFTSATLTINKNFRFWKSRLGLAGIAGIAEGEAPREEIFESPFNYKERVLLGVPADATPPESENYGGFLSDFVSQAILTAEGGALVLFTSYNLLRKTSAAVRPALEKAGITLFCQGDEERSRLLRSFTEEVSSVLFATDSFWEGVDAPGDTLRLVIICRLPFRVPTDPVLLARMEAIQRQGGNPFIDLSLPEAVMKFKQGFGRLMRRTADRGVVLVTDGRLITKSYGSLFISSLPETRRAIKQSASLMEDMENFLAERVT
jgi:ATP-dependent DNA helicase DinG